MTHSITASSNRNVTKASNTFPLLMGGKISMPRFNRIFVLSQSFDLLLKIEATRSMARIIKSGCNLIARKRLASTKIL